MKKFLLIFSILACSLSLASGQTWLNDKSKHKLMIGNGHGGLNAIDTGKLHQILQSKGNHDPAWINVDSLGIGVIDTAKNFNWTGTHSWIKNALHLTSTDAAVLTNNTPSTIGNIQYSPRLRFRGSAVSQSDSINHTTDWIFENQPVEDNYQITSSLIISNRNDLTGYVKKLAIGSDNSITLYDATSGYVKLLCAGSGTASWTLYLPDNDGNPNQFLCTNGSGITRWNGKMDTVSLSSSTVTVSNAAVTNAHSRIFVTSMSTGVTGALRVTIIDNTSFTITDATGSESGKVSYFILEQI